MAVATVEATVHVAGPVEVEKVGERRLQRQRCLRCDLLMRDERERLPFWLLGDYVAYDEQDGTKLLQRQVLKRGEQRCQGAALTGLYFSETI